MSRVALVLDHLGAKKVEIVKVLRSGLGLEFGAIAESASSGNPVIVRTLFDRAEPMFAERLQLVLEQLEQIGAEYRAYELLASQEFSEMDPSELYRIDSKRLRNMIAARAASIEEQTDLGALQDGDR